MRHPQDIDVLGSLTGLPVTSRFGGLVWAFPIAILITVVDQATKRWALDRLVPGRCDTPDSCIDLIFGARLHLVFNTGAAFARGQGLGPLLGILVFLITIILFAVAWRRVDKAGAVLLGAIAGGAIGNLIDRLTRAEDGFLSGAVVDFIDLGWWPVFNVADAAVVCGVLGFIGRSWMEGSKDVRPGDGTVEPGETNVVDPADDDDEMSAQSGDTHR